MSPQASSACPGGTLHVKEQCWGHCTWRSLPALPTSCLRAASTSPTYKSLGLTCSVVMHPVFFHSFVSRMLCPSSNICFQSHLLWDATLPHTRASHHWTTLLPPAVCATIHLSLLLKDGAPLNSPVYCPLPGT